jgi:SAM-dependent methyltransferase
MPRNHSAINDYYAARAAEYDDVYRKTARQTDLRSIEKWLPPLLASRRVLEIACGTGHWTQFIALTADHVVAIDSAIEVVNIARTKVAADKVTFHVADAYQLPKEAGICTAAFAGFWISHVPIDRRKEFLRGLCAVLTPGSPVLLLDNRFVPGSSSVISETDSDGNTFQTRPLKDGSTHRVLKNFPSEPELHTTIRGLGVEAVYTEWQHFWAFQFATKRSAI